MKLVSAMVLTFFGVACGGKVQSSATPVAPGTYSFNEHPRGMRGTFEGTFRVLGDTVLVDATPGPCHPASVARQSKASPITYECGDVMVYFDRVDPVHRSGFRYTEITQEKKNVCVMYETTPTGQQRCTRTSVEVTDKPVSRNAVLHTFPASSGTK